MILRSAALGPQATWNRLFSIGSDVPSEKDQLRSKDGFIFPGASVLWSDSWFWRLWLMLACRIVNDPDHKAANALLGVWNQYQQEPGSSDWELFSGYELENFRCSSMCSGIPVDWKHSDSGCGQR